MNPGICPKEEITYDKGRMYDRIADFIGPVVRQPVCDVGELNHKSQWLASHYKVPITQIESTNFDYWLSTLGKEYNTIFCFEVLSHLVNPGLLIWNLKDKLDVNGILYLSMPSRPRIMWNSHHYNEISHERFQRWILDEHNLEIVRSKKIRNAQYPVKWTSYLGIRPLIRAVLTIGLSFTK
jgi:hypothetical protein